MALLSTRYFYGNLHSDYGYMQAHHVVRRIDKSGFVRGLHALKEQLLALFSAIAQSLKELNTSSNYLIYSFLVAMCDNILIPFCYLPRPRPTVASA